ncbi:MAG: hypothetical protein JO133_00520 [Burkholderiaceae bacterium]|nr:hypothetical protein [Burkholderiaceae bacterium]
MDPSGERSRDDLIVTRGWRGAAVRSLQRRCAAGEYTRVAPGIYLKREGSSPQAAQVRRHWLRILRELAPGAVVSYRSACPPGFPELAEDLLVLSHPTRFNRTVALPGLRVALVRGPGPLAGDHPIDGGQLHCASIERMLLENLTRIRGAQGRSRGEQYVRRQLEHILQVQGAAALVGLRERARTLSRPLAMPRQFQRLQELIEGFLPRQSPLQMLERLAHRLRSMRWPQNAAPARTETDRLQRAFVEAWSDCFDRFERRVFSQARAALLAGGGAVAPHAGPIADLARVLRLASTVPLCNSVPPHGAAFAAALRARHALLRGPNHPSARVAGEAGRSAAERTDAGTDRDLTVGSLLALGTPEGLARAIFYFVLVNVVRPFERDNSTAAHLLMNAELAGADQERVIVPARLRPRLETCMQRLLDGGDASAAVRLLRRLQRWTALLDFGALDSLLARLARKLP